MRKRSTRRLAGALVAGAVLLAACGGDDDAGSSDAATAEPAAADDTDDTDDTADGTIDDAADDTPATDTSATESPSPEGPVDVEQAEPSPENVTVSGLSIARGGGDAAAAPDPLVDLAELRSGGPPPDGIPSIDDPVFIRPAEVDFLDDNEPVLAFEIDGDARAYPVQILMWHEIVNDTVSGVPVAVTYCPLCNSALAYDRRVGDRVMEFGTSGLLFNSALVMYDRQTETLWSHFTAEGIVGELTGVELDTFPLSTVPWSLWRDANPDGLVLTRDTGFDRNYGVNPYAGYDDVDSQPFLFEGEVDGRYTAMTRIVGVELDDHAVGVPLVTLQEAGVMTAQVGDTDLVYFWQPGTASALDDGRVASGRDVGATGVFDPTIDGETLDFSPTDEGFVDEQTGSTWNLLGQAVDGELEGEELEPIEHVDTFWFAWGAFRPDTEVIDG